MILRASCRAAGVRTKPLSDKTEKRNQVGGHKRTYVHARFWKTSPNQNCWRARTVFMENTEGLCPGGLMSGVGWLMSGRAYVREGLFPGGLLTAHPFFIKKKGAKTLLILILLPIFRLFRLLFLCFGFLLCLLRLIYIIFAYFFYIFEYCLGFHFHNLWYNVSLLLAIINKINIQIHQKHHCLSYFNGAYWLS